LLRSARKVEKAEDTSAIVSGSERFYIRSMRWNHEGLEVIWVHEITDGRTGYDYVERPWIMLHCRFRDAGGSPIGDKLDVDYGHDPRFLRGESTEEAATFVISPPDTARYVVIQYGASNIETGKVEIPEKPTVVGEWWERVAQMFP
jgi:hypothetical protein